MQPLTLVISLIGSVLVLVFQPAKAFAVYIITLLFYPTFLTLPLGTLNFKAGRIVVLVLLLRCLANTRIRSSFKLSVIDKWIFAGTGVAMIVPFFSCHIPFMQLFASKCGELMDTLLAYLVARFCIRDRFSFVTAMKWIGMAIIPLALLGAVESCTGWMPFVPLRKYCPWDTKTLVITNRSGFFRATGPSGHPITFGASFAMFVPLFYYLRHCGGISRKSCYLMAAMAVLGTLSSMSSGPWMLLLVIIVCLIFENYRKWIKPFIIFGVSSLIVISVISNRPFYHVVATYANPLGGTGWHRARLIDLAIEHFDEWWLMGYGERDPGWGEELGNDWTDITNHYIVAGVISGIAGVITLVGTLVVSLMMTIRCYKTEKEYAAKSIFWALGSLIVSFMIAFNSFTLFAQSGTLFICLLGVTASLTGHSLLSHRLQKDISAYRTGPAILEKVPIR